MINEKIQGAFNEQLNAELYSAYLYLSMSAYFESAGLRGFANWMRCQAQEEVVHAMKFYTFIHERGGKVNLKSIDGPPVSWDSALAAFQDAYAHEQKISELMNGLVDLALERKDHMANAFLQWFVNEQVEEEASADEIIQRIKLAGEGGGMFMLDRELATRVFIPPAQQAV